MYCVGKTEYEADFIYFDLKIRYITEVEIKTSIQDFKRDFKKKRYHDCENVKYLYYAVPRSLYNDHSDDIDKLLGNAGLILIDEIDEQLRDEISDYGTLDDIQAGEIEEFDIALDKLIRQWLIRNNRIPNGVYFDDEIIYKVVNGKAVKIGKAI